MSRPDVHLLHGPIADHAFSADRQTLAVARGQVVDLYARAGAGFRPQRADQELRHEKTVSGVDIAPRSGRLVTCSQDRNAIVWTPRSDGTYDRSLVLLRIGRAATTVRWSPSETKFAVGSADRAVAVCYFEGDDNWWVSKHLKKPIRSTVTALAWHPNSVLLAAGSTDAHARVLSAFVKSVDQKPPPSRWGERLPWATVCGEFLNNSAGWVHAVAFSPSGDALAFAAHDCSITVVYPAAPDQPPAAVVNVVSQSLPCMTLLWTSESEILAAGYDCQVFRYRGDADGWTLAGSLDSKAGAQGPAAREDSALNMFRQMDLRGKAKDDTVLKTVHQNTVGTIRVFEVSGSGVSKISSSGVDGRVVIWSV